MDKCIGLLETPYTNRAIRRFPAGPHPRFRHLEGYRSGNAGV
jgi:hypothetical protein